MTRELFTYEDDTCFSCQHKKVKKIEGQLNLNFFSLCDYLMDNKFSIHLSQDKTMQILFKTKFNSKEAEPLSIVY